MRFSFVYLVAALILSVSCGSSPEPSHDIDVLPEISVFLQQHSEFGKPITTESVPDWANGKRQRISFNTGRSLLFYTKNGQVMTVYEDQSSAGRVKVWGETEEYNVPAPVTKAAEADLPAYTVLFTVEKFRGGGRYGEILVPSVSRKVSAAEREALARRIADKEHLVDVNLYSSEDAYKANGSESFSKAHPNAMRRGFLGMLENGKFTPGEALYP